MPPAKGSSVVSPSRLRAIARKGAVLVDPDSIPRRRIFRVCKRVLSRGYETSGYTGLVKFEPGS